MKQKFYESEFIDEIVGDEYNSMTVEGARALFEWYEQLEESTGETIEFNRVDIRCEWTEYDNLEQISLEYQDIETLEDLQDKTTVIEIEGSDRLIIQDF